MQTHAAVALVHHVSLCLRHGPVPAAAGLANSNCALAIRTSASAVSAFARVSHARRASAAAAVARRECCPVGSQMRCDYWKRRVGSEYSNPAAIPFN